MHIPHLLSKEVLAIHTEQGLGHEYYVSLRSPAQLIYDQLRIDEDTLLDDAIRPRCTGQAAMQCQASD